MGLTTERQYRCWKIDCLGPGLSTTSTVLDRTTFLLSVKHCRTVDLFCGPFWRTVLVVEYDTFVGLSITEELSGAKQTGEILKINILITILGVIKNGWDRD